MSLTPDEAERLQSAITELDTLSSVADMEGNQEILDELYLLMTQILERYPQLEEMDEE